MHYYSFNIGDYASHTAHLSPMEDLAYRRMLDWYYLHGKPLPGDAKEIARLIRMNECSTSVEVVLNEFFVRIEAGAESEWSNRRADEEIAAYYDKKTKNSSAGKASAAARQAAKTTPKAGESNKRSTPVEHPLNACSTDVQPTINQEPLTNNHKNPPLVPQGGERDGFAEFWQAYPKRVAKGAAEKAWAKIKPDAALVTAILAAVAWQAKSTKWAEDGGKYIPHPATWLNAKRWEDAPDAAAKAADPLWPFEDPAPEQARVMMGGGR